MGYFFNKKKQEMKPSVINTISNSGNEPKQEVSAKNNEKKEKETMTNEEKVQAIESIVLDVKPVKRIKKEKGLIERTETSKVILTEDNKQLLMD